MDGIFDLVGLIVVFLLGGGVFWFLDSRRPRTELSDPPTAEELNKTREDKENELRNQDPETFIDNNLDNANDVNDVKRTSDGEFDRILDEHRRKKDVDG